MKRRFTGSRTAKGLIVDPDEQSDVVGFDIEHASRKFDLSKVETVSLPVASAAE